MPCDEIFTIPNAIFSPNIPIQNPPVGPLCKEANLIFAISGIGPSLCTRRQSVLFHRP